MWRARSADRLAAIAEVRAYWEGLRDGEALPRRDRIDPRGLAGALDLVFMAERVAPGIARFRLAGMQINDLMGLEVRGMPLSALFDPAGRVSLATAIEAMFAAGTPVQLALEAERGLGRPQLGATLLLLPLQATREDAHLMLGCLAPHGAVGHAPRRFAVARVQAKGEEDIRHLTASPMVRAGSNIASRMPEPGFAEPAASFRADQTRRPSAERPYLRLVRSND